MVQTTEGTLKALGTLQVKEPNRDLPWVLAGPAVSLWETSHFSPFCLRLRSKYLVTFNLIGSSWMLLKAEAKLGKGVDEQRDQLIPMSKFSQNGAFSGFETQREHHQRLEPV